MHKISLRIVDIRRFNEDNEKSNRLVDDLSAAALGMLNGGAMGYSQFIHIRDEFKQHIDHVANSYRTVEVE